MTIKWQYLISFFLKKKKKLYHYNYTNKNLEELFYRNFNYINIIIIFFLKKKRQKNSNLNK